MRIVPFIQDASVDHVPSRHSRMFQAGIQGNPERLDARLRAAGVDAGTGMTRPLSDRVMFPSFERF